MNSRADGRNTTPQDDFKIWSQEFEKVQAHLPKSRGVEKLFWLEKCAWIVLQVGTIWVLRERMGFPKTEDSCLSILHQNGKIDLMEFRLLKYIIEARKLSSRLMSDLDESLFENEMTAELALVKRFLELSRDSTF